MRTVHRATIAGFGCLLLAVLLGVLLSAQASFNTSYQTTDFSGEWTEIPHEIGFTAELYDYSGLPVNAAGRMRFDTGDISDWSIPEFVCRPHPGVYNWFYGGGNRITKEIDPVTRELTAYHVQFFRAPDRPIYMDGRPHPPEWAPHTWAGFSTGKFDGNTLVITTTHLKESYIRANTALFSEKSTVTEYIVLDGDIMTVPLSSRILYTWRNLTCNRSVFGETSIRSCRSSPARSAWRMSPRVFPTSCLERTRMSQTPPRSWDFPSKR